MHGTHLGTETCRIVQRERLREEHTGKKSQTLADVVLRGDDGDWQHGVWTRVLRYGKCRGLHKKCQPDYSDVERDNEMGCEARFTAGGVERDPITEQEAEVISKALLTHWPAKTRSLEIDNTAGGGGTLIQVPPSNHFRCARYSLIVKASMLVVLVYALECLRRRRVCVPVLTPFPVPTLHFLPALQMDLATRCRIKKKNCYPEKKRVPIICCIFAEGTET